MLIYCNKIPNKKKTEQEQKKSNLSFELYNSITLVKSEHWNSIVEYGSEFLQLSYLKVLENSHPHNMNFYYAIIYELNKPVAIAYFQVIEFKPEKFQQLVGSVNLEKTCIITQYIKKYIANHIIRNIDIRLLICGNSFISGEHGFAYLPQTNVTKLFDALADIIYTINKDEKGNGKIAAILAKDFHLNNLLADELIEFDYHDFLAEPNMIVTNQWQTFDEYLNSMSKKYRNRAKTIIKKGEHLERRNFFVEDIYENSEVIEKLYDNVLLKAKFSLSSLSVAYFAEMKKLLKADFIFTAYYYNNKIVGFKTYFVLKNIIEAHFIGLDYSLNKELELYQNILYDYVKAMLFTKKNQLYLGRTASEIKSTVGAEAQELKCYIRHRNPLSNRIIKPFVDYLKPSLWIPRSPFKTQEE
ncbi:MAG: hypothetical protein ABI315_08775 [Bacteroidia bacterium]